MQRLSVVCVVFGLFLMGVLSACGDSEQSYSPDRFSELGEECRATNDCAKGMSCIRQTCVTTQFPVKQTGNECVAIECEDSSSCNTRNATDEQCAEYRVGCMEGSSLACDNYFEYSCRDQQECASDRCVALQERECRVNGLSQNYDGCLSGYTCEKIGGEDAEGYLGRCVEAEAEEPEDECEIDTECPRFHRCEEAQCVEVGCQSDRECVAWLEDGLAQCDTNSGACSLPCVHDADCNPPHRYEFMGCIDKLCVHLGCETDEECRGQIGGGSDSVRYECRPR